MRKKPPPVGPRGLFAAVAAISTAVTATAHAVERSTVIDRSAASVPIAAAGSNSATPFS